MIKEQILIVISVVGINIRFYGKVLIKEIRIRQVAISNIISPKLRNRIVVVLVQLILLFNTVVTLIRHLLSVIKKCQGLRGIVSTSYNIYPIFFFGFPNTYLGFALSDDWFLGAVFPILFSSVPWRLIK
jgi:hypothetical protein